MRESGYTNREMLQFVARMQAKDGSKQNRLGWLDDSLRTSEESDVVFFVGCLPFADKLFGGVVETGLLEIARSAIRLLNAVGVEPNVMKAEVCCGVDFHLLGERPTFESLCAQNVDNLKKAKAKTILTACSDGAYMLGQYAALGFDHGCEVMHVAEYAASRLSGESFAPGAAILPSALVGPTGATEPLDTSKMESLLGPNTHNLASLAGRPIDILAGGWLPTNAAARNRLDGLLNTAVEAGCERVVTTCPRCFLSLRYAQRATSWQQSYILVQDLTVALARLVGGR